MALTMTCGFDEASKKWNIKLEGEVDVATATELRALLTKKYEEMPADFALDLSDLCYIDSTGLGVLIGAYGRMKEKGNVIRIEHPRENIAKLLRITSLDKIFGGDIHD